MVLHLQKRQNIILIFQDDKENFTQVFNIMGATVFYLLKFKAKDSEIKKISFVFRKYFKGFYS